LIARKLIPLGLLVALALCAAPAAQAAMRYTAPGASGAEPCNPAPCAFAQAVNGAADGDKVVVASGSYVTSAEVELDHAIEVGGEPGSSRPLIVLVGHELVVRNPSAVLHDLNLTQNGMTMAGALGLEAGTVERIFAKTGEGGAPCLLSGGLLRDSVCEGFLIADGIEPGPQHITLRNVTALPLLVAASAGSALSVDAANVIAHSLDGSHADIEIDVSSGASAALSMTHSNYATVSTTLSAGTDFTFPAPGTNGNQTAPPQFVDAAASDFRPLESSPTVDAGLSDSLIGSLALGGDPRSLGKCVGGKGIPDIGANEFVPTLPCPKPSNAFKLGKLKRNAAKGTATLTAILPRSGTLALAGKGLVARKRHHVKAGKATLVVAAKGKWKRRLLRTGAVNLRARVTFTPTGGDPRTITKKVRLALRHP
jgi:hypothetical protein